MPLSAEAAVKSFFNESSSKELTQAIGRAIARARETERHVSLAHVVFELLADETVVRTVADQIRVQAGTVLSQQIASSPTVGASAFGFKLEALLEPAKQLSQKWVSTSAVSPLAFLATCLNSTISLDQNSQRTREVLRAAGLTIESLMPVSEDKTVVLQREFRFESLGFGTDLTAKAAAGFWRSCPLIGMGDELRKLIKVLNAKADSVILIGEPGVGKSALIEGLAHKIVYKDRTVVPGSLDSWTIVMIEAADIIKGAGVVGGLERELKKMLDFFRRNPTVIPFFDEIHRLLDTGDENIKAIATALKPPMANGLFRCIGATTNREYAQYIASDDAMRSRFRRVQLVEPDLKTASLIIEGSMQRLLEGRAGELGVSIQPDAVEAAVRVTTTYQRTERLPRKAINLLKIAVSEKVYEIDMASERGQTVAVSSSDVARVFSELSDIPVDALDNDRSRYFKLVGERLAGKVIGQRSAIDGVTRWLSLQSKGWFDPRRPRGRFVFTGPPGVGKSELARGLAEELMRDPEALIILDMGDYQDDMAVSKFMGASPGYVGFGATPTVYTRVMTRPYSVIVFDEFEKCNPALSNPLLSILDGFGEDSRGNKVDFSQTIMVMTSNSWDSITKVRSGFSDENLREYLRSLGGMWTAPLLDRVDRVCCFDPLGEEALVKILDALIEKRALAAAQPLPPNVSEIGAKRAILAAAIEEGGRASARRLERAFLEWLDREAHKNVDAETDKLLASEEMVGKT